MASEIGRWEGWEKGDFGMERFRAKPRADHERGPVGIMIKKVAKRFEKKRQVLLIGFPTAYRDNLILFLNGGVELKDIGLNGVRNAVNLFWVGPKPGREFLPKSSRMRGFDRYRGQEF